MDFYKYEAAQNDFILVDLLKTDERNVVIMEFLKKSAQMLCDRRRGIGADGILVLTLSDRADAFMHIINSDGSIAAMCGNGIRCAARYPLRSTVSVQAPHPRSLAAAVYRYPGWSAACALYFGRCQ